MLSLDQPQPLSRIVESVDAKTPLGSAMRTAEWARMPAGLRDAAFFSASVESTRWLQMAKDGIADIIGRASAVNENGEPYWKMDRARLLTDLRRFGEQIALQRPGGREGGKIREADLTDPLSIARLRLIIETQMEMAYGKADWLTGMDPDVLEAFPAQELVRISARQVPRDWPRRWREAGGKLQADGRMIALKTDGIWKRLSRFGNPYPPFDFRSGMGVEDIDRAEAEALGLIGPDDVLRPNVAEHEEMLAASVRGLSDASVASLKKQLGGQVEVVADELRVRPMRLLAVQPPRADGSSVPLKKKVVPQPKVGRGLLETPDLPTREEAEIINFATERAWAYDEKGRKVGFADGTATALDVPAYLSMPGMTLTHNHPSGTGFSAYDLLFLARHDLRELRVIGHQGRSRRWLSRLSMQGMSDAERMRAASRYDELLAEEQRALALLVQAGEMTGAEAARTLEFRVMDKLASELQGALFYVTMLLS